MKVVYYYSPRQEQACANLEIFKRKTPTIDGMKYTEMRHLEDDDDIPLKNKWPDSSIVLIRHGLDAIIGPLGVRHAKLS